jgi:hypothetical protein
MGLIQLSKAGSHLEQPMREKPATANMARTSPNGRRIPQAECCVLCDFYCTVNGRKWSASSRIPRNQYIREPCTKPMDGSQWRSARAMIGIGREGNACPVSRLTTGYVGNATLCKRRKTVEFPNFAFMLATGKRGVWSDS